MKIMKTAWRNLWRSRGRTLLSASAILVSALIITLLLGFETGFVGDMVQNVTGNMTGQIRVMNADYVKNERVTPLQFFIPDTAKALAALSSAEGTRLATAKSEFGVSLYRNGEQVPVRAIGLDFAQSPIITGKNANLASGRFPEKGKNEILVSAGLSSELGIKAGDRLTAITRTAIQGSNGRTFTVTGVLALSDISMINRVIFMDWNLAGDFLRMNGNALQVQVFLKKGVSETQALPAVKAALSGAGYGEGALESTIWYDVSGMYSFFKVADAMYLIISAIFFALASTVVINTTMMSVLERRKEIGALGALGMEKNRIVALFLAESLLIGVMGTAAGTLLGFAGVTVMGRVGFDVNLFGGDSLTGFNISQFIYPSLEPHKYFIVAAIGVAITLAACFLPARMAAAIEPAEALRDK